MLACIVYSSGAMDPVEVTTPPCAPPVKFVEPKDRLPIAIVVVVMITPRSPVGVSVIVNVSDGLNAHARPHAIIPTAAANPSTAFIFRFIVLSPFSFPRSRSPRRAYSLRCTFPFSPQLLLASTLQPSVRDLRRHRHRHRLLRFRRRRRRQLQLHPQVPADVQRQAVQVLIALVLARTVAHLPRRRRQQVLRHARALEVCQRRRRRVKQRVHRQLIHRVRVAVRRQAPPAREARLHRVLQRSDRPRRGHHHPLHPTREVRRTQRQRTHRDRRRRDDHSPVSHRRQRDRERVRRVKRPRPPPRHQPQRRRQSPHRFHLPFHCPFPLFISSLPLTAASLFSPLHLPLLTSASLGLNITALSS